MTRFKHNFSRLVLSVIICTFAQATLAENDASSDVTLLESELKNADKFDLNLTSPTAPGLIVVGISPKDAAEPGNIKDFAVDIANFVDGDQIKPGLAVSGSPFWWFRESDERIYTLDQYREEAFLNRLFARSQFSLGTARASSETAEDSVLVGFGVQTQLLDEQDHKLYSGDESCIQKAWDKLVSDQAAFAEQQAEQKVLAKLGKTKEQIKSEGLAAEIEYIKMLSEETTKLAAEIDPGSFPEERKRCIAEAEKQFLNSNSWTIGAGVASLSETGSFDELSYGGASLWSTYRMPIINRGAGALTFFGRGDLDREFSLKDGSTSEADAVLVAMGGVYETKSWKADITLSYNYKDYSDSTLDDDDFFRYTGTAAFKIQDGVWIEGSAGAVTGAKFEEEGFAVVNLKLDFGD